jgi:hypothetical protein
MKKAVFTIILSIALAISYGQIKMHPSGQISFQSTNTTGGVQIDTSGKTVFEPLLTTSYAKINQTKCYTTMVKVWDIQLDNPQVNPNEPFYVLSNGTVYGCSFYSFPAGGGTTPSRGSQPITNATELLSCIGGYYYDNTEFVGFEPDYENNPEVAPEAIEGLMKDLEVERVLGLNANEIEAVLPEAVRHDPQGAVCINYQALIPVLIEGFKEQQHTIESLQNQIAELKSEYRGTFGIGEQELSSNVLYQNVPNPTNSSTSIDCYLDSHVSKAVIAVYDLNGLQLKEYPVYHKGKNTITIEANEFKPGIYMYSLLVEGKLIDTKRMVVTSK